MINIALHWIDQGIAVIPIGYRSKKPNTRFLHNGEWLKYQSTLPCRGELNEWFACKLTNIAIVTGWRNLCIIDFDHHMAHELWQSIYQLDTYTIATGRGYHYYLYVEDFPKHTLKWAGGEIKASGYCLIPPSVHPTGRRYEIANDAPIMRINNIYDVFPAGLFDQPTITPLQGPSFDPYANFYPGNVGCDEINQRVRMVSFFNNPTRSGNGWYTVICPLHEDNRASGWINDNANRYGCHVCINGSLSAIDFYMRLNQCDLITAMRELS